MSTAAHEAVYASVAKPWLKYYDASFIGQPLPDCTTFEYLYQQNKQHLNEPALEYFGRKITYGRSFCQHQKDRCRLPCHWPEEGRHCPRWSAS